MALTGVKRRGFVKRGPEGVWRLTGQVPLAEDRIALGGPPDHEGGACGRGLLRRLRDHDAPSLRRRGGISPSPEVCYPVPSLPSYGMGIGNAAALTQADAPVTKLSAWMR